MDVSRKLVFMHVFVAQIPCCMKSRDDYLGFVSDIAFCKLSWGMRKKEAVFTSRSLQLNVKQAPPDASCDEESITTVTNALLCILPCPFTKCL